MREFDMHGRGHGRGFGRHRMGKGLVIGAVIFIVLGLLVMSLWNALLPAILGVKAIGFWQALGILVLSRILFGAHRRMHERWMNMTPEQREAFMQQRREGFGRHGRGHCGWHGHRDDKREDNAPKAPDAE